MRQQVKIVYENDDELEINFNCDEDPRSRNRLTFRLHPPSSATQTESLRDKSKDADKSPEIHTSDNSNPVELVIKVWKYKGFLIVQHGEKIFIVYGRSGNYLAEFGKLEDAQSFVEKKLEESVSEMESKAHEDEAWRPRCR